MVIVDTNVIVAAIRDNDSAKNILANVEAYYQSIFNASYATLNSFDAITGNFGKTDKGRNMGIEIDVQQQLNKGFYYSY